MSGTNPAFRIISERLEKRIESALKELEKERVSDHAWYSIQEMTNSVKDYMAVSKACIEHISKEHA